MAQLGDTRRRVFGEPPSKRTDCGYTGCKTHPTLWVLITKSRGAECWEARCTKHTELKRSR